MKAREEKLAVTGASLHVRSIGHGPPLLVLHGGPDFDHRYFLPELDELSDSFRLIYYDQRGRGSSADGVRPEDVTLATELADLDQVRRHFGLEAPVLLGHSWGAVLALEYALRHPEHLSHLILMNPSPVSASDLALMRSRYVVLLGDQLIRQDEIMNGDAYRRGDPAAVTARYRIHFGPALPDPDHHEKLMARMEAAFRSQGPDGILKAWAVEDRLMRETRQVPGYDRLPRLRRLRAPTLVIAGDRDFIPSEVPRHIAAAIPGARLTTIGSCGHFPFLERPGEFRTALIDFFRG
jgi:proline iminopeptidase